MGGQWPNLAAFEAWSEDIRTLAQSTPNAPIPFAAVKVLQEQPELTDVDREWLRALELAEGFTP